MGRERLRTRPQAVNDLPKLNRLYEPKKKLRYSEILRSLDKQAVADVGFVARIEVRSCGCDEVVSFSCDEKENRLPHPQLARV